MNEDYIEKASKNVNKRIVLNRFLSKFIQLIDMHLEYLTFITMNIC